MIEAYETVHSREDALSMHRHSGAFLSLVLCGAYDERSVDGCYGLSAGNVIFHPPFHAHSNHFLSDDVKVLNVALPDGVGVTEPYSVSSTHNHSSLERLMRARPCDLVEQLDDLFSVRYEPLKPKANWVEDLSSALSHEEPTGRIEALASEVGVSAAHASRQFFREYGMSPVSYRREKQLRRAIGVLESGVSLAAAAAEAGFSDQSHMGRAFKAAFGATPREVQKRLARS